MYLCEGARSEAEPALECCLGTEGVVAPKPQLSWMTGGWIAGGGRAHRDPADGCSSRATLTVEERRVVAGEGICLSVGTGEMAGNRLKARRAVRVVCKKGRKCSLI